MRMRMSCKKATQFVEVSKKLPDSHVVSPGRCLPDSPVVSPAQHRRCLPDSLATYPWCLPLIQSCHFPCSTYKVPRQPKVPDSPTLQDVLAGGFVLMTDFQMRRVCSYDRLSNALTRCCGCKTYSGIKIGLRVYHSFQEGCGYKTCSGIKIELLVCPSFVDTRLAVASGLNCLYALAFRKGVDTRLAVASKLNCLYALTLWIQDLQDCFV